MSWLVSMPSRWELRSPKSLFDERRAPNLPDDVHLTPSQKYGVIPQSEYMELTGGSVVLNLIGQNTMKHVEPDDFIIHLRSFQGGLEHARQPGKVSTAYTVIKPKNAINPKFFRWLLKSSAFIQELQTTTNQLRDGQSIRWSDFVKVPLPTPPLAEQRAIADYLDRETQKIDELITEQRSLIETLRERRQAVIDSVFGVKDANSRMYAACLDVVDCPHSTPEIDLDGEFEAVRTASIRNGSFRQGHGLRVSEATWRERNAGGAPRLGDVLFTREAPAGEACMVPDINVCLGQRMVLLRVNQARADGRFIMWQIYSRIVQDYFRAHSNGSTVNNVRLPLLRGLPIWLPSVGEQRQVTAYLDDQTSRIDELISESEDLITLSQERRAALITAAVTGQIDVRTAS